MQVAVSRRLCMGHARMPWRLQGRVHPSLLTTRPTLSSYSSAGAAASHQRTHTHTAKGNPKKLHTVDVLVHMQVCCMHARKH